MISFNNYVLLWPQRVQMTKSEAIAKLKATGQLSTDMLAPLGIPFESFLRLAQLPKSRADEIVEKLTQSYVDVSDNG